jgi:hypothetical protein
MAARTFRKRGLRRDRNFGDIPNPELALNNMLGGLVQTEDDRFVSADLNIIRGLSATTMTNADVRNIDNAAIKGTDPTDPLAVFRPIITLQNRFDQSRFTIGDPQFFGGDGLTTRYFSQDNVDIDAPGYEGIVDPNLSQSFFDEQGNEVTSTTFWENGQYSFLGSIHESLPEIYGAVEWNGYFIPNRSGSWRFTVNTTGLFSFEFNAHTGDTVADIDAFTAKRVHPVMTISTELADTSIPGPLNEAQVEDSNQFGEAVIDQILEGDIVTGSVAPFNDPNVPVFVESVDRENRIVEFSAEYTSSGQTIDLDYNHPFGTTGTMVYSTNNLTEYTAYPVRFRYMWVEAFSGANNPGLFDINEINFILDPPGTSSADDLNYRYLYSENYNIGPALNSPLSGDFYEFFNDRIPPGGTRLAINNDGSIGTTTGFGGYQNVTTLGNVVSTYEPPQNYSDAVYEKSLGYSAGSTILSTGNTDGIEVGNFVLGANVPGDTVVTEIARNEAVFISNPVSSGSGSQTFYFCDHKGLKFVDQSVSYSSGSNSISSVSSTDGLNDGDVVITAGTTSTSAWTRIASASGSSITTTQNFSASAPSSPENFLLVYYDAGIVDESLDTYCDINSGDPICSPPVDTSAPFDTTINGLSTPSSSPNITTTASNSEIKFVKLIVGSSAVSSASVTDDFNHAVSITDGAGDEFEILSVL